MLDASGYYAGGIYETNELRLTEPEQCFKLNDEIAEVFWTNQPFYVNDSVVPFDVQVAVAQYRLVIPSSPFDSQNVYQSACVPATCTEQDLRQILSYNFIPGAKFNRFIKHVELVNVRVLKRDVDFLTENYYLFGLGWVLENLGSNPNNPGP